MRAFLPLVAAVALLAAPSGAAKDSAFYSLRLDGGSSATRVVCTKSRSVTLAEEAPRAVISLHRGFRSDARLPFVISVRRCVGSGLRSVKRIRAVIRPGRGSVTKALGDLPPADYKVEALLNGDRPAPRGAVRYLRVR